MYDSSHPSKSISGLLNKAIKLFTTYKVDTTPFINQAASAYTEVGWMTLHWLFLIAIMVSPFPPDYPEISEREEAGEFIR